MPCPCCELLETRRVWPAPRNAQALYLKQHKCDVIVSCPDDGGCRSIFFFFILRAGHLSAVSCIYFGCHVYFCFVMHIYRFLFAASENDGCVLSEISLMFGSVLVVVYIALQKL